MSFKTLKLKNEQLDFLFKSLETDGLVRISKFGVFIVKRSKPRKFYHFLSDREIVSGARNQLKFRPFTKTKEKIKSFLYV